MAWTYGRGDPKNAYFLSGLISCLLSLFVMLTYVLFPRLQGKLFMKIITLISLCDFIANSTVIFGEPYNHELCFLQGLLQQFFYVASWIWTVIMTYLLYSLVTKGKITLPEWAMHFISWSVALLCTVLPLTTSTYGAQANDDDWCWIQPRYLNHKSIQLSELWIYLTFDCVIFGSFFLMTLWGILIFHRVRVQQIPTSKTVKSALRTLLMYPIILFITWFPNAIFMLAGIEGISGPHVMIAVNSLSIWQGGLTAIVFFYNSKESRTHWYNVFRVFFACCFSKNSNDRDSTIETDGSDAQSGSSLGRFLRRIRRVDTNTSSTAETVEEDFESDDAYYGRSEASSSIGYGRDSSIALNEFKNPIYRPR
jgi:hypothetical protein